MNDDLIRRIYYSSSKYSKTHKQDLNNFMEFYYLILSFITHHQLTITYKFDIKSPKEYIFKAPVGKTMWTQNVGRCTWTPSGRIPTSSAKWRPATRSSTQPWHKQTSSFSRVISTTGNWLVISIGRRLYLSRRHFRQDCCV